MVLSGKSYPTNVSSGFKSYLYSCLFIIFCYKGQLGTEIFLSCFWYEENNKTKVMHLQMKGEWDKWYLTIVLWSGSEISKCKVSDNVTISHYTWCWFLVYGWSMWVGKLPRKEQNLSRYGHMLQEMGGCYSFLMHESVWDHVLGFSG